MQRSLLTGLRTMGKVHHLVSFWLLSWNFISIQLYARSSGILDVHQQLHNFCKTVNLPLTNGQQITGGSCNPAPIGVIPSKDKMPASNWVFPKNGDTVLENQMLTIQMNIKNLETGNFVNAQQNYFSALQQTSDQDFIKDTLMLSSSSCQHLTLQISQIRTCSFQGAQRCCSSHCGCHGWSACWCPSVVIHKYCLESPTARFVYC